MVEVNSIDTEDIASAWMTTTPDVYAEFPAVAARQLGWTHVPLMQSHEMAVPGMLPAVYPSPSPPQHRERTT